MKRFKEGDTRVALETENYHTTKKGKRSVKRYTHKELGALDLSDLEKVRSDGTSKNSFIIFEPGNLRGRVSQKNNRPHIVWFFRYRSASTRKDRDIGCGTWPAQTIASIRKRHAKYAIQVANGLDPKEQGDLARLITASKLIEEKNKIEEERRAKIAEQESLQTVDDLFTAWLNQLNRKDDSKQDRTRIKAYVKPEIGHVPVKKLTEKNVLEMLKKVHSGSPGKTRNRTTQLVYENMKEAFAWAERRQPWRRLLSEENPVDLINIKSVLTRGYRNVRVRVLSRDEITELDHRFAAIRADYLAARPGEKYEGVRPIQEKTEIAIWILLSTLSRSGALAQARWEHVSFHDDIWHIPRENMKANSAETHEAMDIYMSAFTANLMRRLHRITGHTKWLFPSHGNKTPVCHKSFSRPINERQTPVDEPLKTKGRTRNGSLILVGGDWQPHDMRRTGATHMQSLGLGPAVINMCQGHVVALGVDAHYLHFDFDAEKKRAWAAWGAELTQLAPLVTQIR